MTDDDSPQQGQRTPRLVRLVLALGVTAVPILTYPYLLLDRSLSRIDVQSQLLYAVLVTHVLTAAGAMLLGALQFVPRVRARLSRHRSIGRAFLVLGTVAFAATGVPLAITTPDGNLTRYGTLVPASLWPVVAVLGLRAARRHDIVRHREWMTRLYALTFFAVTARLLVPLLLLVQLPLMEPGSGNGARAAVQATIPVGQWLGWMLNLAIAEVCVRRWRRLRSGGSTSAALHPDHAGTDPERAGVEQG